MRPRTALAIATAVGACLACVRMTSFDLPLAIAGGGRLLATGEVPTTNPWNWPNPGFPWLDDKWGFGLLCAAVERLGGGAALSVLNMLLGAAAGALLCAVALRKSLPRTALGVALLAVTLCSYRAMLRAEWISILGVGWTLLHLEGALARDRRRVALLVAAMPLWAACHVYWLLGPGLVLAASVVSKSWRGALAGAVMFAAAAVSPYGLANLVHPFRIAKGASHLEGAITELRRPFLDPGPFTYFHVLALLIALVLWWRCISIERGAWTPEGGHGLRMFGRRLVVPLVHEPPERRVAFVVMLVLVVGAFRYDRNLPLLAPAFAFTSPPPRDGTEGRFACWPGVSALVALVGLVAGIASLAPERTFGVGWDERVQPFALVASLPPETRTHRYVNDFSVGSFLDWKRGASFIDGNSHGYPIEHFELYRRALEGSVTVGDMDARFPNDGWFLRTSAPHTRVLVVGLFLEGDYAPTDADDVATLFRKVDDPERADELWRAWLADRYLPVARVWFADEIALVGKPPQWPSAGDVAAWRALVVASPWHKPFLDGLRAAFDARGETVQAARIWRLARRLGDGPHKLTNSR